MTRLLLRLSCAAAALVAVTTIASAADLPPPPEELRPAEYDWTGPYIGGFIGGNFLETAYVPSCPGCDPDLSGDGFHGGVYGGYNLQLDSLLVGIEGDWAWGGKQAQNILDAVEFDLDQIATIRARLGFVMDATLLYVTGGFAWADTTIHALVGPDSIPTSDSVDMMGWVIGGGIEHAVFENLHVKLEYLYGELDADDDFDLTTDVPGNEGGTVDLDMDSLHLIRAGVSWNFGWY
jgi:outer membrane immunogenic protein